MSLFRRMKNAFSQSALSSSQSPADSERAINLYIEAANERLREFRVQVQRIQAQSLETARKIKDLDDFIQRYHELAKEALEKGNEELARKHLEEERQERDRQLALQRQKAEYDHVATQLSAQYEKLSDRVNRAKAARSDLVARQSVANAQMDAFQTISDVDIHNPLRDFDQLEMDVMRQEARAEAEYEVFHDSHRDSLSEAIAKLEREMEDLEGK